MRILRPNYPDVYVLICFSFVFKFQAFLERLNSLRVSLRANKLVKPHPSPLPPPPQSFSDSPRKRRGRGYTAVTVTNTAGQNSGVLKRSSGSTSKKQGGQSIAAGFNATDYHNRSNDPSQKLPY